MWANYDYSKFPIVKVKFNESIKNEEEFNEFLRDWIHLYEKKEDFSFIFDVSNVNAFKLCYVFKMRKFIKKIKEFPRQYLRKSIIIVSNKYIKYLLSLVFNVQKPVAPVYIYYKKENENIDYNELYSNIEKNNLDNFNVIMP